MTDGTSEFETKLPEDPIPEPEIPQQPESQPKRQPEPPPREFEDFTLAEALTMFRKRPISTLAAIVAVARIPSNGEITNRAASPSIFAEPKPARRVFPSISLVSPMQSETTAPDAAVQPLVTEDDQEILSEEPPVLAPAPDVEIATYIPPTIRIARFVLRLLGLVIALVGSYNMISAVVRPELGYIDNGLYTFVIAILVWWIGESLPFWSRVVRHVPRTANNPNVMPFRCDDMALLPLTVTRMAALAVTVVAAIGAFIWNGDNMFTAQGVVAWVVAIIAGIWTLSPERWSPLTFFQEFARWVGRIRIRITPSLIALITIMIVGGYFRFYDLPGTPPEMTSDHVEKLLDVQGIFDGRPNVFFANNGGREAIQFYYLAALHTVTGIPLNFDLLKLATILEGLLTLPILYWMGRELIGKRDRNLGEVVGLLLAAFVAVSSWHVFLSRLGLKIVLTPLFTALALGFLARGLRYNRRWDFIYTGIAIGLGFYGYQALRMLPLVALLGVAIALLVGSRTNRVRITLIWNLAALVVVAAVIFVPLYRFSVDYPDLFWNRTSGRLLGDEITQTTDANGNLIHRDPTLQEEIDAFSAALPNLVTNVRNALLMFDWKGDIAWFHNPPNKPALDVVTGGLLLAGVGAWLARAARRGDPVDWLLLPAIFIMMLPSILSLAFPIENPSHTRMSGTLPGIYLLIALPLGLLAIEIRRLIGRAGGVLAVIASVALIGFSFSASARTYFTDYRASYISSALPYSVGGDMMFRFAVIDDNGYGNIFHLAYPYWWDHRALAIEGGDIKWNNTIIRLEDIPQTLRNAVLRDPTDPYWLDPNKSILFFFSTDDEASRTWLTDQFPDGVSQTITTYMPRTFDVFTAAPPGYHLLNGIFLEANLDPIPVP